jgi:hypothetical protein
MWSLSLWPQYIMAAFLLWNLIACLQQTGRKYNSGWAHYILDLVIVGGLAYVLHAGGFW